MRFDPAFLWFVMCCGVMGAAILGVLSVELYKIGAHRKALQNYFLVFLAGFLDYKMATILPALEWAWILTPLTAVLAAILCVCVVLVLKIVRHFDPLAE